MNKLQTILIMSILMIFTSPMINASWVDIKIEKIIKDNPLIIIGKIEKISTTKASKGEIDIAYIKISELLKNKLKNKKIKIGDKIPLSMPGKKKKLSFGTDIRYKKDQEGIWILEFKNNVYWATYPKDFQPLKEKKKIIKIIKSQKTK
ncbi:MAG: hypothetical protein COA79_12095 [Planctomycetota bacterium]|nr:MAG: hypothetical protein COA79_12095 [Planctomycetota bacterium]